MKEKYPMCRNWPRCTCIVRGYVNPREPSDCGRKPTRPPRPVILTRREQVGWEDSR